MRPTAAIQSPAAAPCSFAGHARAAGYPHAFEFDALDTFEAEIGNIMSLEGPVFTTLKVVPGEKAAHDFEFANSRETHRAFTTAIAEVIAQRERRNA